MTGAEIAERRQAAIRVAVKRTIREMITDNRDQLIVDAFIRSDSGTHLSEIMKVMDAIEVVTDINKL